MHFFQVLNRLSAPLDWVLSVFPAKQPNDGENIQVFVEDRAILAMSSLRADLAVLSPGYAMPPAPAICRRGGTPRAGSPHCGAEPVQWHDRTPVMAMRRVELDGKRPARIRSPAVAS